MKPLAITGLVASWLLLTAGSCATISGPEAPVKTVMVFAPTPVSCIPADAPAAPANPVTAEAMKAAPDAAGRYQLLAQFWTQFMPVLAYEGDLVEACRKAGPPPAADKPY